MAKDITQALANLTEEASGQNSRRDNTLPAPKPVSAIPSRTGIGRPGGGATGSIAGPLNEISYAARERWPEVAVPSTDGILVWKVKPIKSVQFVDGNGSTLPVNYAQPT